MRGTAHYRGEEQRVYTLRANSIYLLSRGYIPFKWKLYYFRPNVILLSSECYITFRQKLYYVSPKPIRAANEGTIEPSSKERSRASEVRSSSAAK